MDKNTKDILDALDFIKERLVTKDDVRDIIKEEVQPIVRAMIVEVVPGIIALEVKPMREQLKQIEKRLDTIEQHYANLKGVTPHPKSVHFPSKIRVLLSRQLPQLASSCPGTRLYTLQLKLNMIRDV